MPLHSGSIASRPSTCNPSSTTNLARNNSASAAEEGRFQAIRASTAQERRREFKLRLDSRSGSRSHNDGQAQSILKEDAVASGKGRTWQRPLPWLKSSLWGRLGLSRLPSYIGKRWAGLEESPGDKDSLIGKDFLECDSKMRAKVVQKTALKSVTARSLK
jgi:hypothetical protein